MRNEVDHKAEDQRVANEEMTTKLVKAWTVWQWRVPDYLEEVQLVRLFGHGLSSY